MKTFREIKRYQKLTELLIPKLSFQRLIREVLQKMVPLEANNFHIPSVALEAIQEAAERCLTFFFESESSNLVIAA